MAREAEVSRILVFGGTGYIGKHIVRASVSLGHPTCIYARPTGPQTGPSNLNLRREFRSVGINIIEVCVPLFLSLSCEGSLFRCIRVCASALLFHFNREVWGCGFDMHPIIDKGYVSFQLYFWLLCYMLWISSLATYLQSMNPKISWRNRDKEKLAINIYVLHWIVVAMK